MSSQKTQLRRALALTMFSAALLLNAVEQAWMIGAYPLERTALRLGVLGALLFAAVCITPPGATLRTWHARVLVGSLLAIGVVPLFALGNVPNALASALVRTPYPGLVLTAYRRVLDWDRDGYSAALGGGDCNDRDPRVNPSRREIPRNGRDDDCRFGDRQTLTSRTNQEAVPRAPGPSPVSVVLITVDTLSAAHLGAYGYSRPTTPSLDRWAREHGRLFENAYTPGTSTHLALAAMMRGVYARRLHWSPVQTVDTFGVTRLSAMPIREWRWTLAEWLSRRGMFTLALTDDGTSRWLHPAHNISGRFDEWTDARQLFPETDDAALSRAVMARLAQLPRDRRFFLWVHYYGPHDPTTRHADVPHFGNSLRDQYDHEISAFDRGIAGLLEVLVQRQREGEPLVVALTGDHGEDIQEGHRGHGYTSNENSVRVPLVISAPGLTKGRVRSPVTTLDLFPTLLGYTDTPAPPNLDGRDLRALFSAEAPRIVLAEGWAYEPNAARHHDQIVASDGSYRLIRYLDTAHSELESVAHARAGRSENLLDRMSRPALEHALDTFLDEVEPPDLEGDVASAMRTPTEPGAARR